MPTGLRSARRRADGAAVSGRSHCEAGVNLNASNTRKCPRPRLQTCTARFHSPQRDCLSHLTRLVKSHPSLLMGSIGVKDHAQPSTPPGCSAARQTLSSNMTRQSGGGGGCQRAGAGRGRGSLTAPHRPGVPQRHWLGAERRPEDRHRSPGPA